VTRCHICREPCVREVEPAFGDHLPAVTETDVWAVAMRNGIYVDACIDCWGKWPDEHKVFPAVGFGRSPEDEPKRSHIQITELAGLLESA
jgi:hypothetical protein